MRGRPQPAVRVAGSGGVPDLLSGGVALQEDALSHISLPLFGCSPAVAPSRNRCMPSCERHPRI